MTPAESGDQDVEAGDVFVEITEKTQFPGFWFFRRVEFGAWQRQKKAPEKNCASEDQDLGVCDMLSSIQKPKWKSWLDGLLPDWVLRGLPNGQRVGVGNSELLVERQDEGHVYKIGIQAAHEHEPGRVVRLDFGEESDGTRRLLNLISALYRASATGAVYFIDEIDRSMHPMLVRQFLEVFLRSHDGGPRQLIVTDLARIVLFALSHIEREKVEVMQTRKAGMELSNPQLLHVGAEARLKLKEWAETEGVSVNAIVVSVLEEFFKRLKKSKALREELRLEIRAHRGFLPG